MLGICVADDHIIGVVFCCELIPGRLDLDFAKTAEMHDLFHHDRAVGGIGDLFRGNDLVRDHEKVLIAFFFRTRKGSAYYEISKSEYGQKEKKGENEKVRSRFVDA